MNSLERRLSRLRNFNAWVSGSDPKLAGEVADAANTEMLEFAASPEALDKAVNLESISLRRTRPVLAIKENVGSEHMNYFVDRRLLQMKMHGLVLSCAAALTVAIRATGLIPALDLLRVDRGSARIDWTFVPNTAGTLALVLLTGLIAGNLWTDRFTPSVRLVDRFFQSILRFAYFPAAVLIYITLAQAYGAAAFAALGVGISSADALPRDLGAIGLAACVIGYLAFGVGMRIVAERREEETWRESARRLWTAPAREDRAPPSSRAPDPTQREPTPSSRPDSGPERPVAA